MSKLYAIGDLHLSFASDKPMDVFGSEWANHHRRIEDQWRSIVGKDDVVFIPGDISWALKLEDAVPDLEWIRELPGTKVFLKGNHDLWWNSVSRLRNLWPGEMLFIQNDSLVMGEGASAVALTGSRGWLTPQDKNYTATADEKIYKRELGRLRLALESARKSGAPRIIAAMHYQPTGGGRESEFTQMFTEFGVETVIYGHLHGRDAYKKGIQGTIGGVRYLLVSADYIAFRPQLITEL
ncbi:MAG: metallophosphoesterase [Clostridiales Family XIII bacterium]|nr:metallophosphoesterase [Clostridiales Family XIII bacterium]